MIFTFFTPLKGDLDRRLVDDLWDTWSSSCGSWEEINKCHITEMNWIINLHLIMSVIVLVLDFSLFSLLNIVSAFISLYEWHSDCKRDALRLKEFTDQKLKIPSAHYFLTQLPLTALNVSFLMEMSLTKPPVLSHVQNLKIETGTLSECNQVPLRRARGVLPFCL